ncbi:MAG: hypothetical protein IJQ39_06540 [Thermoguttaceae bacterium]|nr:hypothetical protein [Thermoguttaceae bacterium]
MFSNPFSTKFIRPGAIAYQCAPGKSISYYADCFLSNGQRGQVIGPHGTGKSTFVIAIQKELAARGLAVHLVTLHSFDKSELKNLQTLRRDSILILDGFEQLPFWRRWWIVLSTRWRHVGLLTTSHVSFGLPTLLETSADLETAQKLVRTLTGSEPPENLEALLTKHNGSLREVFFELYDVYEKSQTL